MNIKNAIDSILYCEEDPLEEFKIQISHFVENRNLFLKELCRRIQPETFNREIKKKCYIEVEGGEDIYLYIYSNSDRDKDFPHEEHGAWLNWMRRRRSELPAIAKEMALFDFECSIATPEPEVSEDDGRIRCDNPNITMAFFERKFCLNNFLTYEDFKILMGNIFQCEYEATNEKVKVGSLNNNQIVGIFHEFWKQERKNHNKITQLRIAEAMCAFIKQFEDTTPTNLQSNFSRWKY